MKLGVGLLSRSVLELGTMVTEQETPEFWWGKKSRRKPLLLQPARDSENREHTFFLLVSCPPFFQPRMTVATSCPPPTP